MKKNIFTLIFLTTVLFGVSAQPTIITDYLFAQPSTYKPASNTFKGSSGTIKAFTDTYMDVQNFTNFDYPKDFGYISSETNENSDIELHYGHKFNKAKLGLSLTSNFLSNLTVASEGEKSYAPTFTGRIFLGFKNHGFSYSQGFESVKEGTSSSVPNNDSSLSWENVNAILSWGGSFDANSFYFKPIVSLKYHYVQNHVFSNNHTEGWRVDNFVGSFGTIFDIKPTNNFHHEIEFNVGGGYKQYTIDVVDPNPEKHNGEKPTSDGFIIDFNTNYKVTYSYEDKLQLAMITGINTNFVPFNQYIAYTKDVQAKFFHMALSPYVNFGCVYNVKPDTFSFVLGSEIALPTITYNKVMNKDGKKMGSDTSFSSFTTNFTAGINWNFNKHVGMDASMTLPVSPDFADGFKMSIGIALQK